MEQSQQPSGSYFPTRKQELICGIIILALGLLLVNCLFFCGPNLGFAIACVLCIVCSSGYLLCCGAKPTIYSVLLLGLSIVISAAFARSDDGFVKFIMLCFLFVSTNLGLCLLVKKNQRPAGSIASLADSFSVFFGLGLGQIPAACRGLGHAFRRSGSIAQKGGAILLGLGMTVPILLILIPLLIQADAAFEGMLRHLPQFSVGEILITVLFGFCFSFVVYTRNTALLHTSASCKPLSNRKGISALTINTVLIAVCFVYCVYLVSQLAYLIGGFAGALPEDYTLAEYARRGFFEMAWICALNLSIIVFTLTLCKKELSAPLCTRLLCLFIGIATIFLVATASAKMVLYINRFGLTRLRLLTQVVMVFFGVTTAIICTWLFVPKLPYMKAVVITALLIGAAVSWSDVDTQVARYNVSAYLTGKIESVDVDYLNTLGDGAVPYIEQLRKESADPSIRESAQLIIDNRWTAAPEDFRSWNYVNRRASEILGDPPEAVSTEYPEDDIVIDLEKPPV